MAGTTMRDVARTGFGASGKWVAALLAAICTTAAVADSTLKTELVKPGVYRISGAGGGTVLRVDQRGLIVVDAQREGTYRALMDEVRRITKTDTIPVRALVVTAIGPEQTGNVAPFAAAGAPVIVQERALPRLVADLRASSASAPPGAFVSYHNDYLLRDGDLEAEVEHVGSGRTGADSVVFFRDLRLVAVGELFTHDVPQADRASGGSFAGWAAAIGHALWFDFDVAVPSRGAPVGRRELEAFKARLEALAQRSR
jgi:hypothetical protein